MFNTYRIDSIICPWCGYDWDKFDAHELGNSYEDSDCEKCEDCGEWFTWHREVKLAYSTERLEQDNE